MAMVRTRFEGVVTTREELRAVVGGEPSVRAANKVKDALDHHCRSIIAASPFVLVGTSNATGQCDVSPKGDAPGFVVVLDDRTLAIPDRPGNKRVDGWQNVLENPHVGLLFVVPGKEETLRVNGRAQIVRDEELRARMAVEGKAPPLAVVVEVEECFVHCAKSFKRAGVWEPERWPDTSSIASMARIMQEQTQPDCPLEEVEQAIAESYSKLY